jgi:hypothetical protein
MRVSHRVPNKNASVQDCLCHAHHSLEEITTHRPLAAVALQAPDALVRRFLTGVEVFAVRLAVAPSVFTLFIDVQRIAVFCMVCRRTYRTWWRSDLSNRACRSHRACL